MDRRVLVRGGSGVSRNHLRQRLLADSAKVLGAGNFYSSDSTNFCHSIDHSRFELLQHDITMAKQLLDWTFTTKPKTGLARRIDWFRPGDEG